MIIQSAFLKWWLKKNFGLTQKQVNAITNRTKLSPSERHRLIQIAWLGLAEFFKREYPAITIHSGFNSVTHANLFNTSDQLGFDTKLCFGTDFAYVNKDTEMLPTLKEHQIYRKAQRFQENNTIGIAILNAVSLTDEYRSARKAQLKRLANDLESLGFKAQSTTEPLNIEANLDPTSQRARITNYLNKLIATNPDIILIYLPERERWRRTDPTSLYFIAKSVCISAGVPNQVIIERTVTNVDADANIVMGILGKTGNIPYVLAEELEYTDVIVGLDVSRRTKTSGNGTLNTAAMSRIYTNSGAFLGYAASRPMAVEGEIIPLEVLESILPESEFRGKRVIVHRDGRFVGDEIKNITDWGREIGAEFLPIEVTKSGAGRLYFEQNRNITQAQKGMVFSLENNLAYVVSSLPPSMKATAMPLQIHNYSELSLREAIHSVLALTLLHYGSVRPPRLPVSTHASDKIAGFLNKNIWPGELRGDRPFWL